MNALILAAGEGIRLRPLTLDRPKPMLPVAGKGLLNHIVTWLRRHCIVWVAINLHRCPEAITGYFGDSAAWGRSTTPARTRSWAPTVGAAKKLKPYLDERFVVVYGDVLVDMDLAALIGCHLASGVMTTVALYHVDIPSACGLVDLDGRGRITRFVEKPPPGEVFTDLASTSVLVLEPEILAHVPSAVAHAFDDNLLPRMLESAVALSGYTIPEGEYLIDICSLDKCERAQFECAERGPRC